MASATAPPTPVSISSKINVVAEPRSANTTLSASRKRANSPPDATFISGPGRVPGLVCTQNSARSMPLGPAAAASLSICVVKRARSSLRALRASGLPGAGGDARKILGLARRERVQLVHRRIVLAPRGAQREEPFLD